MADKPKKLSNPVNLTPDNALDYVGALDRDVGNAIEYLDTFPREFTQSAQPSIQRNTFAFWKDSDDSKFYLMKDFAGTTKKIDFDAAGMTYPDAGIAVSTGSAWTTSLTDNSTNWDAAFTHVSANGSSHSFIDQDVTSGATPTFTATNITGVPAASVLAGTFGTGAYVFDNTVTGITALDCDEISNVNGDLKIQPDVQGDVTLFGDTDVGDAVDGKKLIVHRKAAEGDSRIEFFLGDDTHANMLTPANKSLTFDVGGQFELQSGWEQFTYKGSSGANMFKVWTPEGFDQVVWSTYFDSGYQTIFTNAENANNNFDHAAQSSATIFIQSTTDPDTDNTEWGSLSHSGSGTGDGAFNILSGTGEISMGDDNLTTTGTIYNKADNSKHYFGAADDASITYDGTDLIIDSQAAGSGHIVLDSPKTTTGDPAGVEGKIYWNTIDNVIKMYADGGWRTLVSW